MLGKHHYFNKECYLKKCNCWCILPTRSRRLLQMWFTLLPCIEWVETLRQQQNVWWEESARRPLLRHGCSSAAMWAFYSPLPPLRKPSSALCRIPFLPHWVWERTTDEHHALLRDSEWHQWERFHISESPLLSPTPAPLRMVQHPGCRRDLNVTFF